MSLKVPTGKLCWNVWDGLEDMALLRTGRIGLYDLLKSLLAIVLQLCCALIHYGWIFSREIYPSICEVEFS